MMKNFFKKIFFSHPHSRDTRNAYLKLVTRITADAQESVCLKNAFLHAPRAWFVPNGALHEVAMDAPIPIIGGQTNSQPTTVALMLDALSPAHGDRVLDVGFGSGWTTALLAALVGVSGRVYGIELNKEVYAFGAKNLARIMNTPDFALIALRQGDGAQGWREEAPFDKILVSAGARRIPPALSAQLKPGGRMVIPVDARDSSQSLLVIQKQNDGSFSERRIPGFHFVPLLQTYRKQ